MKYIKLTYIQAGIMFISLIVVECLYLIHWEKNKQKDAENGGVACEGAPLHLS